ncbi:MAG: phosphoribosylamine--glycine ligase [Nocardioidaceae bacterium]
MKVLVIGSGGREHALALALTRDCEVTEVHVAPGNPGMTGLATLHDEIEPVDTGAVLVLAKQLGVDLVVIGPEAPLVAGIAEPLRSEGIACFGPGREAAALEGSKAYAKRVMAAAGIPTARSYLCENRGEVVAALAEFGAPLRGQGRRSRGRQGVVVTDDRETAAAHAAACGRVVIEEFLDGPEVSLFGISDGTRVLPMLPAQDFKRLLDGDQGPNTGGMGAYAPLPWLPESFTDEVTAEVLQPAVDEMRRRGVPFIGLLYAGLALTRDGVKVVEFNVRFGDPETQVLLELLDSPLGQVLHAAATGRLDSIGPLEWKDGAAVAVVMAAAGYPDSPRTGDPISGIQAAEARESRASSDVSTGGFRIYQAGTANGPNGLVTCGGRVVAVTGTGPGLATARSQAYEGVWLISFDGEQHRLDIAEAVVASGDDMERRQVQISSPGGL